MHGKESLFLICRSFAFLITPQPAATEPSSVLKNPTFPYIKARPDILLFHHVWLRPCNKRDKPRRFLFALIFCADIAAALSAGAPRYNFALFAPPRAPDADATPSRKFAPFGQRHRLPGFLHNGERCAAVEMNTFCGKDCVRKNWFLILSLYALKY